MDRRSFFSVITGACAGVYAAFVPRRITAKPVVSQKPTEVIHKYFVNRCGNKEPQTYVCHCHKPGDTVMCNYPKCKDYSPGNEKSYVDKYE